MTDQRLTQLSQWLYQHHPKHTLQALAGDASFRRYFRVSTPQQTYIAMDAPPARENCARFVHIANDLRHLDINAPEIVGQDIESGFLLLTDFGDQTLNNALTPENANTWYQISFDTLLKLQQHAQLPQHQLTFYNNGIYSFYEESSWFITWFLQQHAQHNCSAQELAQLEREIHLICAAMLEQPQVVTHRDYHSRNLMTTTTNTLGVLDFQDAVIGPMTYDLVSLLRDCYIDWPDVQVKQWVRDYYERVCRAGLLTDTTCAQFTRWFDWTGLQRHLKCAGLFVRLYRRDHKPGYLEYLPRVLQYIITASTDYPELSTIYTLATRYRQDLIAKV